MLVALDLTQRQAARMLTQAVRQRAKLEIEPRPEGLSELLWGTLDGMEGECVRVLLHDHDPDYPLAALVGSCVDVRTVVAGQLCLFSSFVVGFHHETAPHVVLLEAPKNVQVANRRRFARRAPLEAIGAHVTLPDAAAPLDCELVNLGTTGVGLRCPVAVAEEHALLVGDEYAVDFELPWTGESFNLRAVLCVKNSAGDREHINLGFEFRETPEAVATLARLRAVVQDETARLTETDGY